MALHRYFLITPSSTEAADAVREAYRALGETPLILNVRGRRYVMDEPLVLAEAALRERDISFTEADPLNGYARAGAGRKLNTFRRSAMTKFAPASS